MSLIREYFPQCDRCYEINHDCAEAFANALRKSMRRDGWVRRKGQDVCPRCAEKKPVEGGGSQ